jgi:hypothetical protein
VRLGRVGHSRTSTVPNFDDIFVIRDAASPAAGSPVVVHRVIEPQ